MQLMMKLIIILLIFNFTFLARASQELKSISSPKRIIRQEPVPLLPNKTCNSSTEDDTAYNSANPKNVWICKNSLWIPYQLSLSVGSSKKFSGKSCSHIRNVSTNDCLPSKIYWVQEMERSIEKSREKRKRYRLNKKERTRLQITSSSQPQASISSSHKNHQGDFLGVEEHKVYCEMNNTLDGGGWTLVWQHSYMRDLPLSTNMTFFSNYYKACKNHAKRWCNIPNKARFNPTEQMIVAYHNKQVIYAYKGVFNRNIDYDWTGGYLMAYTQITDKCLYYQGTRPNPIKSLPGIAFSKFSSSCNYHGTGGTIAGTLTNPTNDRWRYCLNRYSATRNGMTIAIYVR